VAIRPSDYVDWAYSIIDGIGANERIPVIDRIGANNLNAQRLSNADYQSYMEDFTPEGLQKTVQLFDIVIDELSLDFQHGEPDKSSYANLIRSIDVEARKKKKYFYMLDLRSVADLGADLDEIEALDKMVIECGCNPLGRGLTEYTPEEGRKTLRVIFELDVVPDYPKSEHVDSLKKSALADQFLSCFNDSVRFYGNDCYAPWNSGYESKRCTHAGLFQTRYELDCGLIIRDDKNIGFVLVAADHW